MTLRTRATCAPRTAGLRAVALVWRHLAMAAAGCTSLVLAVWVDVSRQFQELPEPRNQKAALKAQVAPLQSAPNDLLQRGGRIKMRQS